ncbi:uncharacterized protein LOC142323944 [Lycorma delicatula]|uniref:uncharacterized protein LOC142323944 n=1 Tax=Lycorma delicatula TaxID=130591 RepID=UPI003F514A2F
MSSKKCRLPFNPNSGNSGPRSSESQRRENIDGTSNQNKIKTSTPKKNTPGATNPVDISNISCIRPSSGSFCVRSTPFVNLQGTSSVHSNRRTISRTIGVNRFDTVANNITERKKETKTATADNIDEYVASYNMLMQSILLDNINKESMSRAKDEIDEQVASLQKRIADNVGLLNKTKEQINLIEMNCDFENLLKSYGNDFEITKGNINKTSMNPVDKQSIAVTKELEKMHNKIICENVALPQSSSSIVNLNKSIKDALAAYEELSKSDPCNVESLNENKEASELLKEYGKFHKAIDSTQNSYCSVLPSINTLVLKNCSNKIIAKEMDKNDDVA